MTVKLPSFLRVWLALILLGLALSSCVTPLPAANLVTTATLTITNSAGTTNGQTITFYLSTTNAITYTWTNISPVVGRLLAATNTKDLATTNFFTKIQRDFTNRLLLNYTASNVVTLKTYLNDTFSGSISTNWGTLTFATNNPDNNTTLTVSNLTANTVNVSNRVILIGAATMQATNGAVEGYVWTSGPDGSGSWQPASGGGGSFNPTNTVFYNQTTFRGHAFISTNLWVSNNFFVSQTNFANRLYISNNATILGMLDVGEIQGGGNADLGAVTASSVDVGAGGFSVSSASTFNGTVTTTTNVFIRGTNFANRLYISNNATILGMLDVGEIQGGGNADLGAVTASSVDVGAGGFSVNSASTFNGTVTTTTNVFIRGTNSASYLIVTNSAQFLGPASFNTNVSFFGPVNGSNAAFSGIATFQDVDINGSLNGTTASLSDVNVDSLAVALNSTLNGTLSVLGAATFGAPSTANTNFSVNGTNIVRAFKMTNGAANNYVLTSDANGVGTWQASSGGGGGTALLSTQFATNSGVVYGITGGSWTNLNLYGPSNLTFTYNGGSVTNATNVHIAGSNFVSQLIATNPSVFQTNLAVNGTNTVGSVVATNPSTFQTNLAVNGALLVNNALTNANLTASRALVSDANKVLTNSPTTSTELGYVSGVTSAIQTQLDAKSYLYFSSTNDVFTTNAATSTQYVLTPATGRGTTNLVANTFSAGRNVELDMYLSPSDDAGSASVTYRVYLGSTVVATFAVPIISSNPQDAYLHLSIVCNRAGATGSIRAVGHIIFNDGDLFTPNEADVINSRYSNNSFDTTAAYGLKVTTEFGASGGGKVITNYLTTIKAF